jgi:antitoxin component of MazEF toxin-antitoxin module
MVVLEKLKPTRIRIDHDIGTTKLIDIGNSKGLILSKLLLAMADWHKGDMLDVHYEASENRIVITNVTKVLGELEQKNLRGE